MTDHLGLGIDPESFGAVVAEAILLARDLRDYASDATDPTLNELAERAREILVRTGSFYDLISIAKNNPAPERSTPLTPRQAQCLQFISRYITGNGYAPTYAEIATATGSKSKSHIHRLTEQLVERGALFKIPGAQRSLGVVVGHTALNVTAQARAVEELNPSQSGRGEIAI